MYTPDAASVSVSKTLPFQYAVNGQVPALGVPHVNSRSLSGSPLPCRIGTATSWANTL